MKWQWSMVITVCLIAVAIGMGYLTLLASSLTVYVHAWVPWLFAGLTLVASAGAFWVSRRALEKARREHREEDG